jgi:hypothetical protein
MKGTVLWVNQKSKNRHLEKHTGIMFCNRLSTHNSPLPIFQSAKKKKIFFKYFLKSLIDFHALIQLGLVFTLYWKIKKIGVNCGNVQTTGNTKIINVIFTLICTLYWNGEQIM